MRKNLDVATSMALRLSQNRPRPSTFSRFLLNPPTLTKMPIWSDILRQLLSDTLQIHMLLSKVFSSAAEYVCVGGILQSMTYVNTITFSL